MSDRDGARRVSLPLSCRFVPRPNPSSDQTLRFVPFRHRGIVTNVVTTNGASRARAFAPGGIGNLGPGIDILGCAVTGPGDSVVATKIPRRGIVIEDPGHPDLP